MYHKRILDRETNVLKFSIVDVTWQQSSKYLKKSISGATASIYRSQRLVLSGEEETKGKF